MGYRVTNVEHNCTTRCTTTVGTRSQSNPRKVVMKNFKKFEKVFKSDKDAFVAIPIRFKVVRS